MLALGSVRGGFCSVVYPFGSILKPLHRRLVKLIRLTGLFRWDGEVGRLHTARLLYPSHRPTRPTYRFPHPPAHARICTRSRMTCN